MRRELFTAEHEDFRALVSEFAKRDVEPRLEEWAANGQVDREIYRRAGDLGMLGMDVDERYGGGGVGDFRYGAVLIEELCAVGAMSVVMNLCGFNDLVGPYLSQLGSEDQKKRWLPALCAGRMVSALAMSEPAAGSDLRAIRSAAVRDGDDYILNGSKIFISNGILADVVVVVAKTESSPGVSGMSLFVVERGMPGFERGLPLQKIGLHAQDTAELFFHDVRVPLANLLGEEGEALRYLRQNLVRERLLAAVASTASMRRAFTLTLQYTKARDAFGQRVADFQASKFALAELATEVEVAQAYVDRCIAAQVRGELSDVEAAMCKWWTTELQQRVTTRCLQLHGGYGFMLEYPIAREFIDARASTIYGGTTEIMKELIGRSLVQA